MDTYLWGGTVWTNSFYDTHVGFLTLRKTKRDIKQPLWKEHIFNNFPKHRHPHRKIPELKFCAERNSNLNIVLVRMCDPTNTNNFREKIKYKRIRSKNNIHSKMNFSYVFEIVLMCSILNLTMLNVDILLFTYFHVLFYQIITPSQ